MESFFCICLELADCLEVGRADVKLEAYAVFIFVIMPEFNSDPTAKQV